MLAGIEAMRWEQLVPATSMVGIPAGEATRLGSADRVRARLIQGLAALIGSPADDPVTIEQHVLVWMAAQYGLAEPAPESIFAHVWEETARLVMPVWTVAAGMALLGVPACRDGERQALDRVSFRLIPSTRMRRAMSEEWAHLSQSSPTADALLGHLGPQFHLLHQRPELIPSTLALCMVVALADGRLQREETRLFEGVADILRVGTTTATAIREKINHGFWHCRSNIVPPTTEQPDEIRSNSLRAAQLTLEQHGVLPLLEHDIEDGCLTGLHQTLYLDPDFRVGLKGWNRAPLLWPIGLPVGLLLYLRERFAAAEHRYAFLLAFMAWVMEQQTVSG
ncbi:MAG TPA: hypothetical protein VGO93_00785 [Candidatus Xenobia bacterium]|jgi:hypothetical protein